MSNTVIRRDGSRFVSVAVQSAVAPLEDWDSRDLFPNGMRILSISMHPTVLLDRCEISDGEWGLSGELFAHVASAAEWIKTRQYPGMDGKGILCTPRINQLVNVGNYLVTFELA